MNLSGIVDWDKAWWRTAGGGMSWYGAKAVFFLAFGRAFGVKSTSGQGEVTSGIKIVIDGETQL